MSAPKTPTYTSKEFEALVPKLKAALTSALNKELSDCALPDLGKQPDSDLWDLPTVDSKTVCKLSPTVKAIVGRSLKPRWVRKGGYKSVNEAVEHVIDQLRANCVVDTSVVAAVAMAG